MDIQDDTEISLTYGFQSCLAEDEKFSAIREATHAIYFNVYFYIMCIHVVEFLILCVIFVGKCTNGAFNEEWCLAITKMRFKSLVMDE